MQRTMKDLQESEELCTYCKWTDRGLENRPTVVCYGGEPIMCESSLCEDAYAYYLDATEDEDEG